jgi:hypothetical protein
LAKRSGSYEPGTRDSSSFLTKSTDSRLATPKRMARRLDYQSVPPTLRACAARKAGIESHDSFCIDFVEAGGRCLVPVVGYILGDGSGVEFATRHA